MGPKDIQGLTWKLVGSFWGTLFHRSSSHFVQVGITLIRRLSFPNKTLNPCKKRTLQFWEGRKSAKLNDFTSLFEINIHGFNSSSFCISHRWNLTWSHNNSSFLRKSGPFTIYRYQQIPWESKDECQHLRNWDGFPMARLWILQNFSNSMTFESFKTAFSGIYRLYNSLWIWPIMYWINMELMAWIQSFQDVFLAQPLATPDEEYIVINFLGTHRVLPVINET